MPLKQYTFISVRNNHACGMPIPIEIVYSIHRLCGSNVIASCSCNEPLSLFKEYIFVIVHCVPSPWTLCFTVTGISEACCRMKLLFTISFS